MKMNLERKLLSGLLIFTVLLTISAITPVDAKTDMQIAQELIYGTWAPIESDWIKYRFDEDNIRILDTSNVDPNGWSTIRVEMKDRQGNWIGWNTLFSISLENNEYHLFIIQRRENGNEVIGHEDYRKEYVKVYWDSVVTANEVSLHDSYSEDSAVIGVLYRGDIVEMIPSLTGSKYGFASVKVIKTINKNIKVGTEGYVSVKYLR